MTSRIAILALLAATAAACGGSSLDPAGTGTAGNSGSGAAGTGGTVAGAAGQTIQVGELSFTNGLAVDFTRIAESCHTKPASLLGGFMRQSTLQSRR